MWTPGIEEGIFVSIPVRRFYWEKPDWFIDDEPTQLRGNMSPFSSAGTFFFPFTRTFEKAQSISTEITRV